MKGCSVAKRGTPFSAPAAAAGSAAKPCALYGKPLKRTPTVVRLLARFPPVHVAPWPKHPMEIHFHPMDSPIQGMEISIQGHFSEENGVETCHIVAKKPFSGVSAAECLTDVPEHQAFLIFAYLRARAQPREKNRFSVLKNSGADGMKRLSAAGEVRHVETRFIASLRGCPGLLRLGRGKKNWVSLILFLALHCFGFAQARLRLGRGKKNWVSLILSLALHYFGFAQARLRLGRGKKNWVSLILFLALHYFGFAQDRLRLGNESKNCVFPLHSTRLALLWLRPR